MNRRGFFAALAGLVVAPAAVSALRRPPGIDMSKVKRVFYTRCLWTTTTGPGTKFVAAGKGAPS